MSRDPRPTTAPPASTTGFGVVLKRVTKVYRMPSEERYALDCVDLEVAPGEMLAVMGPSGSGKSTLLHLIGAMDIASEGSIQVGPYDVTQLGRRKQADYRRSIGFVFQRPYLVPNLTAVENVLVPLAPYRTDYDRDDRARGLIESVGLAEHAESLPSQLSGGQQQRVAIARSLVNDPSLLLVDEPTANLDSGMGATVLQVLADLSRARGTTVIVATHDQLVAACCDRTVVLRDGRIPAAPPAGQRA
jgi:putative ABC transport system ATP-binding protein